MERSDLPKLHVPVKLRYRWINLESIAGKLREIEPKDEGAIGLNLLVIRTKGTGEWETFQGYDRIVADIGKVSPYYAEAWLRYNIDTMEDINRPKKFCIYLHKFLVIE